MKKQIVILIACFFTATSLFGASRYWRGLTSTSWNNSANWSTSAGGSGGASVPGSSDKAIFTSTRNNPCTIDVSVVVGGIEIQLGYTSTVTQGSGNTLTVGTQNFSIASGTFSGGNSSIWMTGTFMITGGTFTSTSGTMTCSKDFSYMGGSFSANGGKVIFNATAALSISGSPTFNDVEFTSSTSTYNISGGPIVNGTLTLSGGGNLRIDGATIIANGDITITNTYATTNPGNATINIAGTGTQNFTGSGTDNAGKTCKVTINKPSGTLNLKSTISIGNDFTYTAGTVDASTYTPTVCFSAATTTLTIAGSPSLYNVKFDGASPYSIASGTTLTVNNTLSLLSGGPVTINTGNIDAKGDITITNNNTSSGGSGTLSIVGTGSQTLTGSGTVGQGALPNVVINKSSGTLTLSSIISAKGNFTYTAGTLSVGSSTLAMVDGFNGKTITGSMALNNLTVSSNSTETLNTASGTTVTVNGTLTSSGSGSITFNGGKIHAKGDITVSNTGTSGGGSTELTINGTSSQTFTGNGSASLGRLPTLIINKPSGTLTLASILTMGGDFTYTAGTVDPGSSTIVLLSGNAFTHGSMTFNKLYLYGGSHTLGSNLTLNSDLKIYASATLVQNGKAISVGGNWDNSGTFTGSSAMITFTGTGDKTFGRPSGSETIERLCINKSSGTLTLNCPLIINDSLKLTNGVMVSTSTNYVKLIDNAKATGGSSSSYISGYMKKVGNDAFTFPMGKGTTNYHPITISAPSSATDEFSAQYFNTAQTHGSGTDGTLNNLSTCEYWTLYRDAGTSNVDVTLNWNANSCLIPTGLNNAVVAYWNQDINQWMNLHNNGTTGNSTAGSITIGAVINYGSFALAQCGYALSINNVDPFCAGPTITLTASGGGSYSWNTGATTSSIFVTPTNVTSYTCTGTNSYGCTSIPTRTLTVYPAPAVAISGSPVVCAGGTTLTASGGDTYSWSTGATTTSIVVSPTVKTTYTVTATTNAHNCTASTTHTVRLATDLGQGNTSYGSVTMSDSVEWFKWVADSSTIGAYIINASSNEIKYVSLYAGSCNSISLVSSTAVTQNHDTLPWIYYTGLTPGTVYLKVGKFSSASSPQFSITVRNFVTPSTTMPPCTGTVCNNLITNGDFETDPLVTGSCPGSCTAIANEYRLATATTPMEYACGTFAACVGSNMTNRYCVSSAGVPPFVYSATNGHCNTENQDHTSGTGYFFYGDPPSQSCYACSSSCFVGNPPVPPGLACSTIVWTQSPTVIPGGNYKFSLWYKQLGSVSNPATAPASLWVMVNGVQQLVPFTASGCTWQNRCFLWTAPVGVTTAVIEIWCNGIPSNPGCDFGIDDISFGSVTPVANAGTDQTICMGSSVGIGGSPSVTQGAPSYTYSWTPNNGTLNSTTTANPTASPATTTSYTLAVTDGHGCTSPPDVVTVTVNSLPTITIAAVSSLCLGGNVTLTASGGVTYSWAPGGQTTTSIVVSSSAVATYTVTGTDANGCTKSTATYLSPDCPDFLYEDCRLFLDKSVFSSYPPSVMGYFKIQITEYATPTAPCTGTVTNTIAYTTQPNTTTPFPFDAVTPVNPTSGFPNLILPPGHTPIDLTTNYGYNSSTASWLSPLTVGSDFKIEMYGSLTTNGTYTLVGTPDCITPVSSCAQVTKTIESKSNQNEEAFSYDIYPNPANNIITVACLLPENEQGIFELYDVLGTLCFKYDLNPTKKKTEIDISKLSGGIYHCRITVGKGISTVRKIIVTK